MLIAQMEGPACLDTATRMRSIFNCQAFRHPGARDALASLELAFAELAANAVRHAARKPTHFSVALHLEGGRLRAEFRDDGAPFTGFKRAWKDCTLAAMDPMAESGRGLWLVRQSTDQLVYNHDTLNSWSFSKSIGEHTRPEILLLEDDTTTRGLYTALLSKIGSVTAARSLAEAGAILSGQDFDLVVADYNLDDGEAASLLETRPDLDCPVIFITADSTGAARESGLKHGIHMLLQKPVRPLELRERAAEAVAAHRGHALRAGRRLAAEVSPRIAATEPLVAGAFRLVSRAAMADAGGGDAFFDLGTGGIDGARRRFVLADCMGHGMPARLQAAMLGGLLSGQARDRWGGPDTCLDALSAAIITSPAVGQLIATVLAVDLAGDGSLELASGGHPSPVLLGEGKARVLPLDGAMPGLTATCGARQRKLRLKPGERLFMATDGLAPASNITLEGMPEAICQAIRKSPGLPLDAAANAIEAAAVEALGTNPDDDWTFVLIERAP